LSASPNKVLEGIRQGCAEAFNIKSWLGIRRRLGCRISGSGFKVWHRASIRSSGYASTFIHGEVGSTEGGTIVEAHFSVALPVRVFLIIWFAGLAATNILLIARVAMALVGYDPNMRRSMPTSSFILIVIVIPLFSALACLLVYSCQRSERASLSSRLEEILRGIEAGYTRCPSE